MTRNMPQKLSWVGSKSKFSVLIDFIDDQYTYFDT